MGLCPSLKWRLENGYANVESGAKWEVVQTNASKSASLSSHADVEGRSVDFSGYCQCIGVVMMRKGGWLWNGGMKGRVGGVV